MTMTETTSDRPILEPFGPEYPDLGRTIARMPRATPEQRNARGMAICEAIRKLQRQELDRACKAGTLANAPARCASGTHASDAKSIWKACRGRVAREHAAANRMQARTEEQWKAAYQTAIAARRKAALATAERDVQAAFKTLELALAA